MEQATQERIIRKLLYHLETKTIPIAETESYYPVVNYACETRFDDEYRTIFKNYPIIVGHASQLKNAGDFIACDKLGVPILISRDRHEKVNAFLNVCRHRGARLTVENCGTVEKMFVCPYHGWTYNLEGELMAIPDRKGFPNVDCDNLGLINLPVEEKYGFIWVVPAPNAQADTESFFQFLNLESYNFDSHSLYRDETVEKAFNWKIGIEIYLENYHFNVLHRNSTLPIFVHNLGWCDRLYPHLRVISPKRSIIQLANQNPSQWNIRPHATILYYIFPNTLLFIEKHHASILNIFPKDVDHSIVRISHIVSTGFQSSRKQRHWDMLIDIFMGAIREDLMIGESVQAGIRSGANTHMTFARYEKALDLYHDTVNRVLDGQPPVQE